MSVPTIFSRIIIIKTIRTILFDVFHGSELPVSANVIGIEDSPFTEVVSKY